MWFLHIIFAGQWLTIVTIAILLTAIVVILLRKPKVCGISRQDWAMLIAISTMSLLAVAFIWLFNYYHWSKGIAFLDQFDPNIDILKLCNMVCGFLCIGMVIEPFWRKSTRSGLLGILAAIPGATSILIYG